jgi:hypothetical protein
VNSVIRITGIGDRDPPEWLIRISGMRNRNPANSDREQEPEREGVSEFLCVRRVQSHPPLGKGLYLTNDRPGKAMMRADPCSSVRSMHLFFRPDLPFHRQACAGPVKFAARGGTGATRSPRLGASMARTHNLTGLSTMPRSRPGGG